MFLFVAIILGIFGILLIGSGFWLLFIAKQVKVTSNLINFVFFGSVIASLVRTAAEPQEYYLKGWARILLGLIFIFSGFGVFYAIWLVSSAGLIFY